MGNSDDIGSSAQVLPFRMAGPIDIRPAQKSKYRQYPQEIRVEVSELRSESTQVSAYPISSLSINEGSGLRGLSYGDDLSADAIAISHYGYRVTQPDPFLGQYYVEFRLGILPEDTPGALNYAPFSFILYRGDDNSWAETSTFRESIERYQTEIFPEYFSRPTVPANHPDFDWQFGGGFYAAKWVRDAQGNIIPADNTFNNNASDYGLKYTQARYQDINSYDADMQDYVNVFNDIGVGTMVYEQPWRGSFYNPTMTNDYDDLGDIRDGYNPMSSPIGWGGIWVEIYDAQEANGPSLPTVEDLFSRCISKRRALGNPRDWYHFPVLLIDDPTLGELNVVQQEIDYITAAYSNVSDCSVFGLKGMEFDNMFYGMYSANHLDLTTDRLADHVSSGGCLTYSINHLAPALSQLGLNVWFLKTVRDKLDEIDLSHPYGDGSDPPSNRLEPELISGNFNESLFGGSKHGIMNADVGAFESNVETKYNRSERSQNFRRAMGRDKNITRLLASSYTADCMLDTWINEGCLNWNTLWGYENYDDFRIQLICEVTWMSLAWGFMPSITNLVPEDDAFFDANILPLFRDDPQYGLSYTNIFRELHLAGWRPITNTVVQYDGTPPENELRVERFGDSGTSSAQGDAVYFTVLNNDGLTITPVDLAKLGSTGMQAAKSIEEIEDFQEYCDLDICGNDFSCDDFPSICPADFEDKRKSFYLDIYNGIRLGLWGSTGNIMGIQLVHNPENPTVCNWAEISDYAFTEGPGSLVYSIKRFPNHLSNLIRIGGRWETGSLLQHPIDIPDKALMVFKLWLSTKVDNGDIGAQRSSSRGESTDSAIYMGSHYERYGSGWQTYDSAGYNGTVDAAAIADPDACAYYTINTGASERLEVKVHFPSTSQATGAAQYDVYITDYLEGTARDAALGEPVLTSLVDQGDSTSYTTAQDAEGFISIGTIDVELQEPEVKTIVIKLSAARDQSERSGPSALLISDAVMVAPVE